jgi:preprotein translocase subunit SecG
MYSFLVALEILASLFLIIVVLMQSSKGGGLAGSFGTSGMGTMFGVRRTADFLGKATAYIAIAFMALALIANIFFLPGKKEAAESIIQRGSGTVATPRALPPQSAPAQPAQSTQPPQNKPK